MNPLIPITSRTLIGLTHAILLASLLFFPRLSFGQGRDTWQKANSNAAENRPDPAYPSGAMKQRLKGKVTVSILVGTNGVPATVATMESSGHELLDQHTVNWVRSRWRWPAGQERRYYCIFEYSMK